MAQFRRHARQDVRDVAVDESAREHRADRHDEAREQEQEQRQYEQRRAPPLGPAAASERPPQLVRRTLAGADGRSDRRHDRSAPRPRAGDDATSRPRR
jgi:hypothetical protein